MTMVSHLNSLKRLGELWMNDRKVLFAVSPDYLEVMYKEVQKYNFLMQGYGTFEAASKGLLRVNASELLGFVYLVHRFPVINDAFSEFLFRCNLLSSNKKFIIATLDSSNLDTVKLKQYENLRFELLSISEVLTDIVINSLMNHF